MKRPSQITIFLISLFAIFLIENELCVANAPHQSEAGYENFAIEEEGEVYLVFQEIFEVTPKISGGHPDTVTNKPAAEVSKAGAVIVSSLNIKSKYVPGGCLHLGKLPLYLRYQALKLHC